MKPKPNPRPDKIAARQEPRVQSKTNPALSYGRASGKTYINKGAPLKPKKKSVGSARGGYVSGPATPAKPKPAVPRGAGLVSPYRQHMLKLAQALQNRNKKVTPTTPKKPI